MPQTDYIQWDRILLIKIAAIIQMTFSCILFLLYVYLCALQGWTSTPEGRDSILEYRYLIICMTLLDFGLGSLLAYAANLVRKYRRPKVILWVVFDSLLLPLNAFLLRGVTSALGKSVPLSTDIHLRRIVFGNQIGRRVEIGTPKYLRNKLFILLVHFLYTAMHLIIIMIVINFLAYYNPKTKKYDPTMRPDSVFEPTDPKITTTESRHIRFSQSFLKSNFKQSLHLQPPSSSRNHIQLRVNTPEKIGFYRISLWPLINAFWINRVASVMKSSKWRSKESRSTDVTNRPQQLFLPIYYISSNAPGITRSTTVKSQSTYDPVLKALLLKAHYIINKNLNQR